MRTNLTGKSFLTQQSGQATMSPDHLLGASDGGEHLLLVSEEGGSDFVELGDVVHDEEDVALASRVGRLHADATGLAGVEISGSLLEGGLGGAEVCSGVILLGGQLGLGLGQLSSEFGLLLGGLLLQSVELLLGLVSQFFGRLNGFQVGESDGAHAFDGGGQSGLLSGEFSVDRLDGLSLGNSSGEHAFDLGQTLGHRLLASLLGHLRQDLAHFSLHHGVELIPGPSAHVVVDLDVSLNGGEKVLLHLEVVVLGELHEDDSGGTLHLQDDLGQSTLTDLLQLGQTTSAEHDLGVSASEFIGVQADLDEGLGSASLGVGRRVGERLGGDDRVSGHEVGVGNLVRQTQHANTDALQHAVAVKLVHDERSIDVTGLLDFVGDDATDEVRMSRVQVGHQLHQGLPVGSGDGHHGRSLLLLSGILLSEDKGDDTVSGTSHHSDDGLVHGILVLEEPAGDVVSDGSGVVMDLEVSLGHALLGRLGLAERLVLAQVLAHHLLQVGLVGGLGDDALLLQHGQDAHLLLDQLDGDDQVHAEVDESPLDALGLVLFLLLDEHVVVEELLETLVGVVDEELFQDVELEDLEAGDVENADKVLSGIWRVERVVDKTNNPIKKSGKERLRRGRDSEGNLVQVLSFFHKVFSHLQLRFHKRVDEIINLDTQKFCRFGNAFSAVWLRLFLFALHFPLLVAEVTNRDCSSVEAVLVLLREAESVEGSICGAHLLRVVHLVHRQHALIDKEVVSGEGFFPQQTHAVVTVVGVGHDLVEDVVIPLDLQLEGDAGLFQEVSFDIGGGDFQVPAEVNSDELAESGGVVVSDGLGVSVGLQWRVGLDDLVLQRASVF